MPTLGQALESYMDKHPDRFKHRSVGKPLAPPESLDTPPAVLRDDDPRPDAATGEPVDGDDGPAATMTPGDPETAAGEAGNRPHVAGSGGEPRPAPPQGSHAGSIPHASKAELVREGEKDAPFA